VDNTTDGTIDAVAASIIEAPVAEEQQVEEAEVLEENEAEEISTDEAEEAEAVDDQEDESSEEYDDQEDLEAEEEPAQQLYTVKVDGKTKQVTLDELTRGYSGQAYIQQGMEHLANAKKQMQEMYHVMQEREQQIAEAYERVQSGQGLTKPTPPSKDLFDKDPIGYMQAKIEYDEQVAQYEQTQAQMAQMQQRKVQQSQAQHQAYLQEQLQVLQQAIPELADPKKAPAYRDKMVQAGSNYYGFDPRELNSIDDARYLNVLNDAMKWREMQETRGEVSQKAQSARPVVKPGVKRDGRTSKQKQTREAAARMRKTGDIEDVAKFLLS
jgi:hypothetical protein